MVVLVLLGLASFCGAFQRRRRLACCKVNTESIAESALLGSISLLTQPDLHSSRSAAALLVTVT
jgi:hypothetical protein